MEPSLTSGLHSGVPPPPVASLHLQAERRGAVAMPQGWAHTHPPPPPPLSPVGSSLHGNSPEEVCGVV